MTELKRHHPLPGFLFLGAALVVMLWGINQVQPVLAPFLVAVFLAVLATPPMLWLRGKGLPVVLAVSLVMAVMLGVLLAMGAVVGASVNSFYGALPEYQQRLQTQVTAFKAFVAGRHSVFPGGTPPKFLDPEVLMGLTGRLLLRIGSAFSDLVLVLLTTTFILLEAYSFPRKLRSILGDPKQAFPEFARFINEMKRYMVIKTLVSLATGILVAIWLTLLRVDFPVLWGFLAFLLNYVPNLGSTVAGVPAVLLAYVQFGLVRALVVAVGYITINFVLDYGIETRLMGRKLGLSTLIVFLSLIFWGSLLGPVGAVLCIPLSMTLKFAFESHESTRWIAVLIGPEDSLEAPTGGGHA